MRRFGNVDLFGRAFPAHLDVRHFVAPQLPPAVPPVPRDDHQPERPELSPVDGTEDAALMHSLLKGDRQAFEAIILKYQSIVYGYLRSRLLQTTDAEDLTQEVFLRFFEARQRFDTKARLHPWLMGITRNLLREHLRRCKREKKVVWAELCLDLETLFRDQEGADDESLAHLPECLGSLGESAREAIQMHYTDNLRFTQIGEKLKRSEGAIKLLVFRARQALKRCLDIKIGKATDNP